MLTREGTSEATTPAREEARVLLVSIGEGTSEAEVDDISEPIVIIIISF